MDPDIEFVFEGVAYTVSSKAYDRDLIVLPDKRVLRVYHWSESNHPKPVELVEQPHMLMRLTPQEIAQTLMTVVAEEK